MKMEEISGSYLKACLQRGYLQIHQLWLHDMIAYFHATL